MEHSTSSRYYSWAVIDIEDWSSRSASRGSRIQKAMRGIEAKALQRLGIEWKDVGRQPRGDGAVLALPGDIPKERIATEFVEAISDAVLEHDADCAPEESIRLRISLNAGDALDGDGEWAGQSLIIACRLVDTPVIRRVLKASAGYPLALIVSAQWYDAVIREGYAPGDGYREVWVTVKNYSSSAWVAVPGRRQPLGLLPEDDPDPHRVQDRHVSGGTAGQETGAAAGHLAGGFATDNSGNRGVIIQGTVNGDIPIGNNYYGGTDPRTRR